MNNFLSVFDTLTGALAVGLELPGIDINVQETELDTCFQSEISLLDSVIHGKQAE